MFRAERTTLTVRAITLRELIERAYPEFNDVGRIVGGPDWIRRERFDISAKSEAPLTPASMREALRALLSDRLRLATHIEQRVLNVYAVKQARRGRLGPELKPLSSMRGRTCEGPSTSRWLSDISSATGIARLLWWNCDCSDDPGVSRAPSGHRKNAF
jgi:uncharacterized protein (TIGR03435 family)